MTCTLDQSSANSVSMHSGKPRLTAITISFLGAVGLLDMFVTAVNRDCNTFPMAGGLLDMFVTAVNRDYNKLPMGG